MSRSEYRRQLPADLPVAHVDVALVGDATDEGLAVLLLDAYRGTVDDEGETIVEARQAIAHYRSRLLPDYSVIAREGTTLTGMSFVVVVNDRHYIDPVAVSPTHKRRGIGRAVAATSLHLLAAAGVTEVGATITDGNGASEALFRGLGFERVGPWPPVG